MSREQDAINAGFQEAETRHQHGVNLPEYFEGRDYKGEVAPYVPPVQDQRETTALKPAQIRSLKMFGIGSAVISGCFAFIQQAATGAFNSYFGWAIVGGMGAFFISGLRGGSNPPTRGKGETHHHHYYQNNSFGGGANQTNGK